MLGALIGDIVGSRFEWNNIKTKDFDFLTVECKVTDDSIMTLAIAKTLIDCHGEYSKLGEQVVKYMRSFGRHYPYCDYGSMFRHWLNAELPQTYGSYGNGAAMRVSACAHVAKSMEEAIDLSRIVTEVTHNHPEGIKGAEATASAIFLARTGCTKAQIRAYIEEQFGYDLSRTCDEIRPNYRHVESCQETVPEAITAFLEGESFEDVIRTAVSLGGDCDTLTAIAGSIAEGFYGVSEELKVRCRERLPKKLLDVLSEFDGIMNV